MTPLELLERLAAFAESAARSLPADLGGAPIAIGWATVELDRAAVELATALAVPPGRFASAPDAPLLGARCRIAPNALRDGLALVLLEPSTEGRLAATLARNGEGPAAIWVAVADLRTGSGRHAPMPAVSASSDGPWGAERLVLGGPIHGPHRLLVGPPGTIRA